MQRWTRGWPAFQERVTSHEAGAPTAGKKAAMLHQVKAFAEKYHVPLSQALLASAVQRLQCPGAIHAGLRGISRAAQQRRLELAMAVGLQRLGWIRLAD